MKLILAYSGGLDTSVLVHWFAHHHGAEVITYCADVGQEEELDGLEEKAMATGAHAHRTLDLVDEFARTLFILWLVEMRFMKANTSWALPLHVRSSPRHKLIWLENSMPIQWLMEQPAKEMTNAVSSLPFLPSLPT